MTARGRRCSATAATARQPADASSTTVSQRIGTIMFFLAVLLAGCQSLGPRTTTERPEPIDQLPPRQSDAITGSQFLLLTRELSADARERAILDQVRSGNVPEHVRAMVPLAIEATPHRATLLISADYLAIGSAEDYVSIPMMPDTARQIAREFGFLLPTRKLVEDIYHQASVRLAPQPMPPGPYMATNAYYRRHNRLILKQIPGHAESHRLLAGHKKDIVLTPQLLERPERLAIYGWHRQDGNPIQPLSLYHPARYVDYSHGVRLVSRQARVDGKPVDLAKIFADPELNILVSDEGGFAVDSYL